MCTMETLQVHKEGEELESVLQGIVSFFSGSIIRRHICDGRLLTGTFTKLFNFKMMDRIRRGEDELIQC